MSIEFGLGISTKKDHIQAVKEATEEATSKIKKEAQIALVFSSIDFCHTFVIKTLTNLLKDTPIVGFSSRIIFLPQGIFKYGIVILLLNLGKDAYLNTAIVSGKEKLSHVCGEELAGKLLADFKDKPRLLNLIFSDRSVERSDFVIGFQEKMGVGFPLFMSSLYDKIGLQKNFIYYKDGLYNNACAGIILGGRINFECKFKHGWRPLGKPQRITKTEHNLIQEIEGEPAVNFYCRYLGYSIEQIQKNLKYVSMLYPLGIYLSEENDYVLRNVVGIQQDGALLVEGEVPSEGKVRIMIATKSSCLQATKEAVESLIIQDQRKSSFFLIFESPARLFLLGNDLEKELELLKEKRINFLGTLSYGKVASSLSFKGVTQIYNHSICFLGF